MLEVVRRGMLAAALMVAAVGCEDAPQPPPQPSQPKPPKPAKRAVQDAKPAKLSAEQKVSMIEDCWSAFDAQDVSKFSLCYGPKTLHEVVDHVPERATKGAQALFAAQAPVRKAFPDMSYELGKIIVSGDEAVVVYSAHGENEGALMGREPTGKSVGYVAAQHLTWGPDGKVATDRHYYDQATFLGQLGLHEQPVRPVRAPGGWGKVEVVVAKHDEREKKNLARYQQLLELNEVRDVEGQLALYADDAVFRYLASPQDAKGKEAIAKDFTAWYALSSDAKSKPRWSWAAGDYVVGGVQTSGTNDGAMGEARPATNEKFSLQGLEIVHIEDGEVTEHWLFGNGMKLAADLGLIDEASAAGEAEDPAGRADDPAEQEKRMVEGTSPAPPSATPTATAAAGQPATKP